jgi:hypothetical protein
VINIVDGLAVVRGLFHGHRGVLVVDEERVDGGDDFDSERLGNFQQTSQTRVHLEDTHSVYVI